MKKALILSFVIFLATTSVFAIEDTPKTKKSFFKHHKEEVNLEKNKKNKRVKVEEIDLPAITSLKKEKQNFITMSLVIFNQLVAGF